MDPKYHGTYWSVGEMQKLDSYVQYMTLEEAAIKLNRKSSACADRLRIINTAKMFQTGSTADTLVTWKKKQTKPADQGPQES